MSPMTQRNFHRLERNIQGLKEFVPEVDSAIFQVIIVIFFPSASRTCRVLCSRVIASTIPSSVSKCRGCSSLRLRDSGHAAILPPKKLGIIYTEGYHPCYPTTTLSISWHLTSKR